MKDKVARMNIAGLAARVDFLSRKLNNVDIRGLIGFSASGLRKDIEELREETQDIRDILVKLSKEPVMYLDEIPGFWKFYPPPNRIPIARAVRLILKHLNMQIHGIEEGFELKEIVDDDNP